MNVRHPDGMSLGSVSPISATDRRWASNRVMREPDGELLAQMLGLVEAPPRRPARPPDPRLVIPCPRCGAAQGVRCGSPAGNANEPHAARRKAAREIRS